MNRWIQASLSALLGLAALVSHAQTCTTTLSPGVAPDLTLAVENATPGAVICLTPGTHTPFINATRFAAPSSFAVGNRVTIKGLGASPSDVILQATAAGGHALFFVNYLPGKSANGSMVMNLTIQGSQGGAQVQDFTTGTPPNNPVMRDITLRDVIITTANTGAGFGVLLFNAERIVLDNVRITSFNTALTFINASDSLVINSTVTNTVAANAAALAVRGGTGNRFVNNTLGSPRTIANSAYSFNGGGIVFYNTSENRFEGNLVQGMRDDALDFTTVDDTNSPATKSLNNYVGKNDISHTAFSLQGSVLGSAGIWSNCAADGTWIYGNETHGAAECGICVWGTRSNMVQGNLNYHNGIAGIFVSGGFETQEFCTAGGATFPFRQKPNYNFLQSNANYFNRNDELVIRDADNTDITRNFASPTNGLGGPTLSCTNPACQAAMSLESVGSNTSTGFRVLANTSLNTTRGLWVDHNNTQGIDFYLNRTINSVNSRYSAATTRNLDRGPLLGGNYWSMHLPSGNPSSTAYPGVFDSVSNTTGRVVDRHPYGSEHLGRGYHISVFEPRAGSSFARGSLRTVRWDSVGCFWVDLTLGGTVLKTLSLMNATNLPNTGYAVVRIPDAATLGNANIVATCKEAGGAPRGTGTSATFTVTSADLKLLSPGRDDVFNAGATTWVSWKNASPSTLTSVSIDASTDGGANWTTLATFNNQNTQPVGAARLALPATGSAYAMVRARSGTAIDQTDGVFSLRGGSGTFSNVGTRTFALGHLERLEWSSPANSRLVTIDATVGATTANVVTDLPDRGSFDWIVPDLGAGTLSLTITFKSMAGTVLSAATFAAAGTTRYPATITLGAPPTVGAGQSGNLTASTNSGAAVTLTTTTPSVCTVSGTTITGQANGVCEINASAPATGNFLAALAVTVSFNVGGGQTITFTAPGYIAVAGTITLSASASSGLSVTFTSLTPGVCSISSGNILTGNSVGNCTVEASQPGNASFAAAQPVQVTIKSRAAPDIPRLVNIATRMQVLTGADVMIGGFIIGGNAPKTVIIRARGPSLIPLGVPNGLLNPVMQLFSGQTQIAVNDNWQEAANAATVQSSGFAPSDPFEAAIYVTLSPGAYTAIVTGANQTTGVGLLEIFEVDLPNIPLLNIATRGQVLTGGDVMIAGFIIQGSEPQTVVVRARGPSMTAAGVPGVLANPKLQLFSGQTEIGSNDNWQTATNQATLQARGFAPSDPLESAILITLNPGAYTAIVTGSTGGTGVGIVEVFGL